MARQTKWLYPALAFRACPTYEISHRRSEPAGPFVEPSLDKRRQQPANDTPTSHAHTQRTHPAVFFILAQPGSHGGQRGICACISLDPDFSRTKHPLKWVVLLDPIRVEDLHQSHCRLHSLSCCLKDTSSLERPAFFFPFRRSKSGSVRQPREWWPGCRMSLYPTFCAKCPSLDLFPPTTRRRFRRRPVLETPPRPGVNQSFSLAESS